MSDEKLVRPLSVVHGLMAQNQRVSVWLEGDKELRFDGLLKGFDEFMNIVLDDASEVNIKSKKRLNVGKMLLKGDNIALIHGMS